eukprot:1691612-Pleurochrysis_carterae.AAC.3
MRELRSGRGAGMADAARSRRACTAAPAACITVRASAAARPHIAAGACNPIDACIARRPRYTQSQGRPTQSLAPSTANERARLNTASLSDVGQSSRAEMGDAIYYDARNGLVTQWAAQMLDTDLLVEPILGVLLMVASVALRRCADVG